MGTTRHQSDSERIDYTPGSALTGGVPTNPGGDIIGYADRDVAASEKDALNWSGLRKVSKANGVTFAVGDTVIYHAYNGNAINPTITPADADDATGLYGLSDIDVGVCVLAAASGDSTVVIKPLEPQERYGSIRPWVIEFDCEDTVDETAGVKNIHTLIPARQNRHGLLMLGVYGLVTEVFAGAGEDQGIVTITDSDGNSLSTLTASNASGDAVNDVLVGTGDVYSATSGDAALTVAAGKGVRGQVTQETAGAGKAGKMKVYCRFIPLI